MKSIQTSPCNGKRMAQAGLPGVEWNRLASLHLYGRRVFAGVAGAAPGGAGNEFH